jgi:hypothetical protein
MVANSSVELVAALKQFALPPHSDSISEIIKEKKSTMKTQIMQEIGEKMESSHREMKDTLSSILDVMRGLADKIN